jgi:hypothetical protein
MKNIVLFVALFISSPLFAQDNGGKVPPVRIGNITTTVATCEQVLAFPRLLVMNPTCVVKSYSMTIISKGKEISGPFKNDGPEFTPAEKAKIKELQGTNVKIVVEDIKVSCQGGPESAANTIFLTCDH